MGSAHLTTELIRSIMEYVDARYESSDRVTSYEVEDASLDINEEFSGGYRSMPVPGAVSAAQESSFEPEVCKSSAPASREKKPAFRKLFSKRVEEGLRKYHPEPEAVSEYVSEDLEPALIMDNGLAPDMSFSMGSARSLEELVNNPGESFAAMLFRLIDEKGLTDPDVYNKAGVSRQTFSKIRSKEDYAPSKDTVIALAMALGLTLDEVQDLLNTAGFALSNSSKSDIIISYFFDHDMHDLDLLNETLYEMGFAVIGG